MKTRLGMSRNRLTHTAFYKSALLQHTIYIFIASIFILGGCKSISPIAGKDLKASYKNVYYTATRDDRQALDIYLPNDTQKDVPTVIYVHGGGYLVGEKEEVAQKGNPLGKLVQQILDNNIALVSINYRLLPDYAYPSQTDDVVNAINYISHNAQKYGLDAKRIVLMGGSAGGHLVQYASDMLGKENISGTVSYFAPTDFTDPDSYADSLSDCPKISFTQLMQLFGVKIPDNFVMHESLLGERAGTQNYIAKAKKISPLYLVSKNTPPILMFHGTKDCLVPITFSYAYQKELQLHKIKEELVVVEGAGHGDAKFFNANYNDKVLIFLNQHLKK